MTRKKQLQEIYNLKRHGIPFKGYEHRKHRKNKRTRPSGRRRIVEKQRLDEINLKKIKDQYNG